MKDVRIGNDINVVWSILNEGEPFAIGENATLYLATPYGKVKVTDYKVNGNQIFWTFFGKDQKHTGKHSLELVINEGKERMVTTDACNFVNLVACSCKVGGADDAGVQTETIELTSTLALSGVSYDDTALWSEIESINEMVEDLQNTKIDKEADDYYPQLSVGTADNLAGDIEVEYEFAFRRSGDDAITDGVARVRSIKGNSVIWNQLYQMSFASGNVSGITFTKQEDNSIKGSGTLTATYANFGQFSANIEGHKYLFLLKGVSSAMNGKKFALLNRGVKVDISNGFAYAFYSNSAPTSGRYIGFDGFSTGETFNETFNVWQIDLTMMFGSGYEPNTIEDFYKRTPMGVGMNAYNEGEIVNMKVDGIKSVGRNAWDEQWESGGIDSKGKPYADASRIRSANFIKVLPSMTYYIAYPNNAQMNINFFDENKEFLSFNSKASSTTFTIPSNAHYIKFAYGQSSAPQTTYNHNICINISDPEFNGTYEPYQEVSEDLSIVSKYFPEGMRSAGSARDEIRYNKQSNRWEKVVRIKIVKLKDLNWAYAASSGYFYSTDTFASYYSVSEICCLSAKYYAMSWSSFVANYGGAKSNAIAVYEVSTGKRLNIVDGRFTDVASFKASLTDDVAYVILAEPIVTEIEEKDFNFDYRVWNNGTEQAIAKGKSSALLADITYGFNAVGLIKQLRLIVDAMAAKLASL